VSTLVVRAEMPATVWKVRVRPGERVAAGDELVVLESMKMEIPVTAPGDGVVGAVLVEEGTVIAAGDALVELQAGSPAADQSPQ
jgi:biotin carboxyl carrier protein